MRIVSDKHITERIFPKATTKCRAENKAKIRKKLPVIRDGT